VARLAIRKQIYHLLPHYPFDNLMIKGIKMLTQSELKSIFHYNPTTGEFTRIKETSKNCPPVGSIAGTITCDGYLSVKVHGKQLLLHRAVFLYMNGRFPFDQVDHINHIRTDNRWSNLREIDGKINTHNQSLNIRNKSGITGVSWCKRSKKWHSQISYKRKGINLGYFDNFDDAVNARLKANEQYCFHKNHGHAKS